MDYLNIKPDLFANLDSTGWVYRLAGASSSSSPELLRRKRRVATRLFSRS
jgi:hypothetical protein